VKPVPLGRYQRGYLFEIPVILIALFVGLALILPHLSVVGQKVLVGVASVPILCCLYYLVVRPIGTPTAVRRSYAYVRLAIFLICAAVAIVLVAAFILR
jgi:hypothetical protein